jgi:hypothetical protein
MIILVIGRRKQGKTTLAYAISLKKPTRVIFDPRRLFKTSDVVLPDANGLYDLMDTESEIIVQPWGDVKESFDKFCDEVDLWMETNRDEPLAIVVDEVRFVDTPNEDYVSFDRILRFSNPSTVDVIVTCHRPVDISTDVRAIADYWCIFKTTQEHDLRAIRERCGEEVANLVDSLGPKEYVLWNDGEGVATVRRDKASWFVPIERKRVAA